MRGLATWCVRHRRLVVLFWAIALVGMTLVSQGVGSAYSNSFSLPKTESTEAIALLQSVSPAVSGDTERIVIGATGGAKVTDPAAKSRITAMMAKVEKVPHVSNVESPFGAGGSTRISKDGTVAFATVTFDRQAQEITKDTADQFVNTAKSAEGPNLKVGVGGQLAELTNNVKLSGTGIGVLLAGVVLLFVFGSLYAMALPLVSALASLGVATALISLLSNVIKMPQFSTELTLLIGLGVGVDYALFIVTRHRQGLIAGHSVEDSIVTAVNTSGRAVRRGDRVHCTTRHVRSRRVIPLRAGRGRVAWSGTHHVRGPHLDPRAARVHWTKGDVTSPASQSGR